MKIKGLIEISGSGSDLGSGDVGSRIGRSSKIPQPGGDPLESWRDLHNPFRFATLLL
jgi:hypothetical protein